jgi:hypothetical protein
LDNPTLLEQGAGFGGRPFCGFLQRPGRPAASSLSTLLSLAGAKNVGRLSLTLGSLTPLAGPLNDGPRVRRIGAREVYQIGIRQKSPAHRSSLSISPRKHREPKLDHDTVQAVGRALGDLFSIRRTVSSALIRLALGCARDPGGGGCQPLAPQSEQFGVRLGGVGSASHRKLPARLIGGDDSSTLDDAPHHAAIDADSRTRGRARTLATEIDNRICHLLWLGKALDEG